MASFQSHLPASLRNQPPSSRRQTSPESVNAVRPYLIPGGKPGSKGKISTAFTALPRESEDARITGATRSLDRRLLALNLNGSRMSVRLRQEVTDSRIA